MRLSFDFGPIGVNKVLGEQKGECLIWAGEPKKALLKYGFKLDLGGYLRSRLLGKETIQGEVDIEQKWEGEQPVLLEQRSGRERRRTGAGGGRREECDARASV